MTSTMAHAAAGIAATRTGGLSTKVSKLGMRLSRFGSESERLCRFVAFVACWMRCPLSGLGLPDSDPGGGVLRPIQLAVLSVAASSTCVAPVFSLRISQFRSCRDRNAWPRSRCERLAHNDLPIQTLRPNVWRESLSPPSSASRLTSKASLARTHCHGKRPRSPGVSRLQASHFVLNSIGRFVIGKPAYVPSHHVEARYGGG
jgi:hypothetical protein